MQWKLSTWYLARSPTSISIVRWLLLYPFSIRVWIRLSIFFFIVEVLFYYYHPSPHIITHNKMSARGHSLNNSPSKQKYSFGKEHRFTYEKPLTDASYLPMVDKDRRSALIGSGTGGQELWYHSTCLRYPEYTGEQEGQCLCRWAIRKKQSTKRIGSYLQNSKGVENLPSPHNYTLPSMIAKKGVSLSPKLPDFSLRQMSKVPGPGAYSVPGTLKVEDERAIVDSRFLNPSSIKIHNSLDISRRKEPVIFQPGPGQYDVQKYGIGNPENPYGKNEFTKFPKSIRQSVQIKEVKHVPGPGNYNIYSEFD